MQTFASSCSYTHVCSTHMLISRCNFLFFLFPLTQKHSNFWVYIIFTFIGVCKTAWLGFMFSSPVDQYIRRNVCILLWVYLFPQILKNLQKLDESFAVIYIAMIWLRVVDAESGCEFVNIFTSSNIFVESYIFCLYVHKYSHDFVENKIWEIFFLEFPAEFCCSVARFPSQM